MRLFVSTALYTAVVMLAPADQTVQAAYLENPHTAMQQEVADFFVVDDVTTAAVTETGTAFGPLTRFDLATEPEILTHIAWTNRQLLAFDRDGDLLTKEEKSAEDVPLLPSAWLFGSGLLGLLGLIKLGKKSNPQLDTIGPD